MAFHPAFQSLFKTLAEALQAGGFVRLTLNQPTGAAGVLKSVDVRPIMVKRELKLSFTFHNKTNDIVKNHGLGDARDLVGNLLGKTFQFAQVFTTAGDFQLNMKLAKPEVMGAYLDDINAQPKLFDRAFYTRFIRGGKGPADFSLDLYLLYMAKVGGHETLTIPVDFAKRLHGEAKGGGTWKGRVKLIRRTFAYILKMRRRLAA